MQNQIKHEITLDTQLKTALLFKEVTHLLLTLQNISRHAKRIQGVIDEFFCDMEFVSLNARQLQV